MSLPLYQHDIEASDGKWTMENLYEGRCNFRQYLMPLYATVVRFQPSFRPSGSMDEGKKYFSWKYKQYGYKVEIPFWPNGLTICYDEH